MWLETAPAQREQFSEVLTWSEFAREQRIDGRDTGIDLVAQLTDSPDDWCAVQCKFYAPDYRIQKGDIDSFFTASGRRPFARRTSSHDCVVGWTENSRLRKWLRANQDEVVRSPRRYRSSVLY